MQSKEKRRNWTEVEDLVLLRQVSFLRPFQARHGDVMTLWDRVAGTLCDEESFQRLVDGKKLQRRFNHLIDKHRKFDKQALRLSGVEEDESETSMILDDLVQLVDDAKIENENDKKKKKLEEKKSEAAGQIIRDEAMKTCKKRKSDTNDETRGNPNLEFRQKKMDIKRAQLEQEAQERRLEREERQKDRELQLKLAELEKRKLELKLTEIEAVKWQRLHSNND
ncbi:hypothetical protein LEN26_016120 [Aphanomyces euteiches]|nr:hypothetical protein LEN26_016120 [Aphanomyces euteiches]KAH9112735.1 hypothetical protein AeMF1_012982 [Aphanomyces euteiches]KAH9181370.1 hypothetical protein AeNC1_016654 [Aphanomyces euteiches]